VKVEDRVEYINMTLLSEIDHNTAAAPYEWKNENPSAARGGPVAAETRKARQRCSIQPKVSAFMSTVPDVQERPPVGGGRSTALCRS
jgi:hypothetical protein